MCRSDRWNADRETGRKRKKNTDISKKTTDGGVSRPISRLAALASRVTYVSMLPALLACKTRHCRTIHPPIASFVFLTRRKMVVRPDGTHVLPGQNRICQNHFFKIQFFFCWKIWGNGCFSYFMGQLWSKYIFLMKNKLGSLNLQSMYVILL